MVVNDHSPVYTASVFGVPTGLRLQITYMYLMIILFERGCQEPYDSGHAKRVLTTVTGNYQLNMIPLFAYQVILCSSVRKM